MTNSNDSKITIPAAKVSQGELTLYTTSLKVGVLVSPGFYDVETLDPSDGQGYQRVLHNARAKRFAEYIVNGHEEGEDAFLPTSVLLATDKDIAFDEQTNAITIDKQAVGPFSVVDGQHRLEGLKKAVEASEAVKDFEVPVNIAVNLPKIHQMCHFLIVNSTQKSVDKSVEQAIMSRLTRALEIEDMPSLPKWIERTVQRGDVDKAVEYVTFLNREPTSPWYDRINMANEARPKLINQRAFVKSIQTSVLSPNNPLTSMGRGDIEREKKIFLNYWKAIFKLLIVDDDPSVLYKSNGAELFCRFSSPFFNKIVDSRDYREDAMSPILKRCFDNVEGDYAGVGSPDWWKVGATASSLNRAAINKVFHALRDALHMSDEDPQI